MLRDLMFTCARYFGHRRAAIGSNFVLTYDALVRHLRDTDSSAAGKPDGGIDYLLQVIALDGCTVLTSGSTGTPVGVSLDAESLTMAAWCTAALAYEAIGEHVSVPESVDDARCQLEQGARRGALDLRVLPYMDFRTVAGITVALRTWLTGGCLIVREPGQTFCQTALEHHAHVLAVPPVALSELRRAPQPLFDELLAVGVGGAHVKHDLCAEIQQRFGGAVTVGYGMTEMGGVVTSTRPSDPVNRRWKTVGRPAPGVRVDVVEDIPGAQRGEGRVLVTSPSASPAFRGIRFDTGDVGSLDDNGDLTLRGRLTDWILRGGQRIPPEPIEDAILALPGVDDVVVIGKTDSKANDERIVACIVPSADANLKPIVLRDRCREQGLPAPHEVYLLASIPRAHDGGLRRRAVRDDVLAGRLRRL
jgi:acyl-CoA synthetase (AMP-forming)/AMP-acid ligase II